jgi:hypothetical protein
MIPHRPAARPRLATWFRTTMSRITVSRLAVRGAVFGTGAGSAVAAAGCDRPAPVKVPSPTRAVAVQRSAVTPERFRVDSSRPSGGRRPHSVEQRGCGDSAVRRRGQPGRRPATRSFHRNNDRCRDRRGGSHRIAGRIRNQTSPPLLIC